MRSRFALCLVAGAWALLPAFAQESGVATHARQHLDARVFELGLDRDHSFKVRHIQADALLDEEDVRVDQFYRGVKVFGGESILHMKNGRIRKHTDGLMRGLKLNPHASLSADEAIAVADKALAPKGPYAYAPSAELVFAPIGTKLALVYHVHTELENGADETAHTDFFVDAHSGKVLDRWDTLHTAGVKGTGKSQFSGSVSLDVNSTATGYELNDVVRTTGTKTYNLNHATSGTGTIYTDADNIWGDSANYVEGSSTTAANGQTAAVDAHYGVQVTWDMYKNVYGRNGIDGAGTAPYSRVHYSNSYDNAFWSDTCFCMTYGDGNSFLTLTALDVAGHEMSHGVCARTAKLAYSGESGGLNEANSDIFGTLAEFYRGGGATGTVIGDTGGNYTIGEQLATPSFNKPLRYMYKPSLDGSSPDAWSKTLGRLDVHYSSGVANHFFFLLAHGSKIDALSGNIQSPMANGVTSITGIGNQKAGQIWYRALTKYMVSTTKYAGARAACLSAATDLYGAGSVEYNTVALAWKAVNVL
ncbi:MAG: M4 family metallopeptidase [Firmicutes bacterium]|nr:M4 family metallopeptidase [Bacillota bacterium]